MSEADDARITRIGEILDTLKRENLPAEERAKLEEELDSIGRVVDPPFIGKVIAYSDWKAVVYSDWKAFVDRLINRQGSIPPDFEAIRRRKAELDRLFWERDSP